MNYRHIYHAGNFADVFKHCTLITLIEAFFHKDKPIFYLDTHAGSALYDLQSEFSKKTNEANEGIKKIYLEKQPPEIVQRYFSIIKEFNQKYKFKPRFYPGSPQLVRKLLRPQDRMHLVELHEEEYTVIKKQFYYDDQISVHHQDAYQALNALLPPKERRGLVLIDPAYEVANEVKLIISGLVKALTKWPTGVYLVWYPIKNEYEHQLFLKKFKTTFSKNEILTAELSIYPLSVPMTLNGSGMLVINPPWQLDRRIETFLPWLWEKLSIDNQGEYRITWLNKG